MTGAPHIFLSAGEASGDLHASALIEHLRALRPDARFTFLGGDMMAAAAGSGPLIHYRDMAYMGFSEVLRNLGKIRANLDTAREALRRERPDALVLVDYPSFNLRLAREARKLDIPVYYFIPPKVWAWKKRRGREIAATTRRVFSILPFEERFWSENFDYQVSYVGNPTVNEVDAKLAALPSREEFCRRHGLDPSRPILALLPGSRRGELRNNLPVMDAVARRHPELQAVIALAPSLDPRLYTAYSSLPGVADATFELLAHARAALVTSGTATLEAALIGVPQVVCYRANGSRFSYNLFKHILNVDYVSLPNLVADRSVVAEQLLHLCTPEAVDARLAPLVDDGEARSLMLAGYADIRRRLGDGIAGREAAAMIVGDLQPSVVGGVVDAQAEAGSGQGDVLE